MVSCSSTITAGENSGQWEKAIGLRDALGGCNRHCHELQLRHSLSKSEQWKLQSVGLLREMKREGVTSHAVTDNSTINTGGPRKWWVMEGLGSSVDDGEVVLLSGRDTGTYNAAIPYECRCRTAIPEFFCIIAH